MFPDLASTDISQMATFVSNDPVSDFFKALQYGMRSQISGLLYNHQDLVSKTGE
jgi:hypothetical protein